VRRQQAAETRERVIAAGSALAHAFPTWDWRQLTFRAVAERAGVSERTVFRYFPTERELHDAVMRRLDAEVGVVYEGLRLEEVAEVTARMFASMSSFAATPRGTPNPTFAAEDRLRRDALLDAVTTSTADWTDAERAAAAALLDVLWSKQSYERLVTQWDLDADRATRVITWAIDLVTRALQNGPRPNS
jgi:AcrR family transcriptional regulator